MPVSSKAPAVSMANDRIVFRQRCSPASAPMHGLILISKIHFYNPQYLVVDINVIDLGHCAFVSSIDALYLRRPSSASLKASTIVADLSADDDCRRFLFEPAIQSTSTFAKSLSLQRGATERYFG